tara:strand:- start:1131 stop:2924 length:1794 start_codon:yes stop_codon:yes gene_type:complete
MSLYLFLNIFDYDKDKNLLSKRLLLIPLVATTMYLSLASKLIAATLPLLLCFWYFVFVFPNKNYGKIWEKYWTYLLVILVVLTAFFLTGESWLYKTKDQGFELYGQLPYLLIQTKVIVFYYLKLFFFPFNLSVDSGMPFSSIEEDPLIILSILIITAIIVAAIQSKNVWLLFGTIWFFITLGPTSSFIPLNDLAVEHRTYLPITLGLCTVIGWGISCLRPCKRLGILSVILIAFSLATISRNGDWVSEISLWQDVTRKNPYSSRAHNNLGKAYFEKGDLTRAGFHFKKSIANIPNFVKEKFNLKNADEFLLRNKRSTNISSNNPNLRLVAEIVEPHYNLASIYLDQGKLDLAEKEYIQTLTLRPGHSSAKIGLGSVYNKKGVFDKAEELYLQAIKDGNSQSNINSYPIAHLNLGEVYAKTGRVPLAIKEWERAIYLDPSLLPAHYNLGTALMMQGKLEPAENYFLNCLNINKIFKPALFNLALLKQKQMRWEESINRFNDYMKITGPSPSALKWIGFNYLNLNDWNNAIAFFGRSLKILPTDATTLMLLGNTFLAQGNPKKAEEKYYAALNLNIDHKLKKVLRAKIKNIRSDKTYNK